MADELPTYTATSVMSKKRLAEIREHLSNLYGQEKLDEAIIGICRIMKFNPTQNTYNPRKGQLVKEYRERCKALGVTPYSKKE